MLIAATVFHGRHVGYGGERPHAVLLVHREFGLVFSSHFPASSVSASRCAFRAFAACLWAAVLFSVALEAFSLMANNEKQVWVWRYA